MSEPIIEHLLEVIPQALTIERACARDDRSGTDYWVKRRCLPALSIDVKNREFCPIEKFKTDDACIETTSVYVGTNSEPWEDAFRKKIGWTLNDSKRTDYVIYTWPNSGGGRRFWIVPFPFLCTASKQYWREWAKKYRERPAVNNGYLTLSIYPPREVIRKSIQSLVYGVKP